MEAAELDAITLLVDTWDHDLDPEVSAQLVQANAQAYLSFGKEKGKGKAKGRSKGSYPVRPSHLSLEDSRQRLKELKAKTEYRAADGRNIGQMIVNARCLPPARQRKTMHVQLVWRHDSVFTNKRVTMGYVSSSTSTVTIPIHPRMVVTLPTEKTEQISVTPTASATTDIKNAATFNERDEPCMGYGGGSQNGLEQNV